MIGDLQIRQINRGLVRGSVEDGAVLCLPRTEQQRYTLAQIDNYMHLPRRKFCHGPPMTLQLEARVSNANLSGTWGFGLWNDPFSVGVTAGGMSRLLPVLPNTAWFFYGCEENHLTLHEDQPGQGFHLKTFSAPLWPSFVSLVGLPILPLLLWPLTARGLRSVARGIIKEDGKALSVETESWHVYRLDWLEEKVVFQIDNNTVFLTPVSPQGRLGMVIWIDNQYFRFDAKGKLGFGSLPIKSEQQLHIRNLQIKNETLSSAV